ncbi:nucleotide sugar dehydrogenase [Streptomyces sp. NBC_00663]|uniref:nucleotide sugar dehydrogenase n=1 Tax=Streptomyces sp. NBC_00663 TaxID=2975801 RepID=UPI002E37D45F|nr:nucleotide sugar dehydrogenase [Streptomyces sp. NBC_00663]
MTQARTTVKPADTTGYVAVIGLGYIGLPLAVSLAAGGHRVVGVDTDPGVRAAVRAGTPRFHEPGLPEQLRALPPGALTVEEHLPDAAPDAVVVCVGTAVHADNQRPDLRHLVAAVTEVADRVTDRTLVVVRSTVPVGTCRNTVLPLLRKRVREPLLAFCPERTIQGRAMEELRSLPQIVGGLDERSVLSAGRLMATCATDQVVVSSLEAAEMIKLICNAHTDLIYGFGNEVALLAERLGLDADELIASANLRYPRPDLSRPGFVGGSCLVKDPYLLMHSGHETGHQMPMVAAARAVNESLPGRLVDRVTKALAAAGKDSADTKVLVCGIAYKGRPATDDTRGSAAVQLAQELGPRVGTLAGHDFTVGRDRIAEIGFRPVNLTEGLRDADAVIVLTDHPDYGTLRAENLLEQMRPDPVVFDMWGLLQNELADLAGLTYLRLGRG